MRGHNYAHGNHDVCRKCGAVHSPPYSLERRKRISSALKKAYAERRIVSAFANPSLAFEKRRIRGIKNWWKRNRSTVRYKWTEHLKPHWFQKGHKPQNVILSEMALHFAMKMSDAIELSDGVRIIVDTREPRYFYEKLSKISGIVVERKTLPIGDYWIEGNNSLFVIERKATLDFIASARDGRLWKQLRNMKDFEQTEQSKNIIPLVFWEGPPTIVTKYGHASPAEIAGLLVSVAIKWKISALYCPSGNYTILHLIAIAKDLSKPAKRLYPVDVKVKALSLNEQVRRILEAFPNIGPTKAEKILLHYHTLHNFFDALLKDEPIDSIVLSISDVDKIKSVLNHSYS